MKVLMFGWEFPPHASGGLGTACYGLTKGLSHKGIEVLFVLPRASRNTNQDFVKIISAEDIKKIKFIEIDSPLTPYLTSAEYLERKNEAIEYGRSDEIKKIYGKNLFEEVYRYRQKAGFIARHNNFDVIHCHDWMTYGAGIEAKKASGKPLVIHVHATEFDRTGGNVNQCVYDLEREGMHAADLIMAVSNLTKQKIIEHYDIPEWKVTVVHNAVEFPEYNEGEMFHIKPYEKIVLFLGRITIQKGPDYFIYAAKKVLEHDPNVKFIIAGSGDMEPFIINKVAELGLSDKILFAGFLKGKDIDKAYKMADLYVMPSISEPFGITPLEAMRNGTPVLISHQSGVSEVINHCLKVDFWDINDMANKMLSVLKYQELHQTLKEHGEMEVKKFNWDIPAEKVITVYNKALCT